MSRELTDEYRDAWIDAYRWVDGHRVTVCLPVTCQDLGRAVDGDCADDEWFPAHAAPDRCYKPAEPDGALEAGERVWVDCPRTGRRGLATIRHTPFWVRGAGEISVRFEKDHMAYDVMRAACHREGPQNPPPDEGAVFLGRRESPRGDSDAWRLPTGRLCIDDIADWSPKEIEGPSHLDDSWRPFYLAALTVARELHLTTEAKVK